MTPARRTPESTEALRASLVEHARRLVARDGAAGLTMRSLAAEAGCATGLPYKVFADRHEIVLEIVHGELLRLKSMGEDLVGRAGVGSVGGNLAWFADAVLKSPAVALVHEVTGDEGLSKEFTHRVHGSGVGPTVIEAAFAAYLAAEQKSGRINALIETDAFAFLLGGAVHNLVMSGEAYPKPTRRQLQQHMTAIANGLAANSQ